MYSLTLGHFTADQTSEGKYRQGRPDRSIGRKFSARSSKSVTQCVTQGRKPQFLGETREMAVDAVWSELLSGINSRYQGKIQGIFSILV
jgi:hypothetical protein